MGGGGVTTRETREGWPLLTVETEANGDSKNTNERGGWFVGLVPVQETFILPWLLWSAPSKKYFFPHSTLFQFMCPHRPATWASSRAEPPVSEYESPVTTPAPKLSAYLPLFPVKIFDDDFRLCLLLLIYPWRLNYVCRILAEPKHVCRIAKLLKQGY
jgi:hypothetical protein